MDIAAAPNVSPRNIRRRRAGKVDDTGDTSAGEYEHRRDSGKYNDARFTFMSSWEKLVILLLAVDASSAVFLTLFPGEQAALAGAIGGSQMLLMPALSLIESAVGFAGYLLWVLSAAETGIWLRDALDLSAKRRALRAAQEAAASEGRTLKPTHIPWWHESWWLWSVRASDAAACALQGALLFTMTRPVFRLTPLARLALRSLHMLLLLEGELDDRTRRAMEVVVRHRDRAEAAEARAATLETAWRGEGDARSSLEATMRLLEEEALSARGEAEVLQEALLVAAQDVARLERRRAPGALPLGRGTDGDAESTPPDAQRSLRRGVGEVVTESAPRPPPAGYRGAFPSTTARQQLQVSWAAVAAEAASAEGDAGPALYGEARPQEGASQWYSHSHGEGGGAGGIGTGTGAGEEWEGYGGDAVPSPFLHADRGSEGSGARDDKDATEAEADNDARDGMGGADENAEWRDADSDGSPTSQAHDTGDQLATSQTEVAAASLSGASAESSDAHDPAGAGLDAFA